MKLLFYLSGEHVSLSQKEIIYLLTRLDKDHQILECDGQLMMAETDIDPAAFSRLGLCHKVLEYLDDDISLEGTFAVRVQSLGRRKADPSLEKEIADEVQRRNPSLTTDLENPDNEIYCLYTDTLYKGRTLVDIDRSGYEERKPQFRPYFHPSSLHPKYARALVNLAGARTEVLDPFCGTGGILIEAGLMGLTVYGLDIEEKMVEGCKKNLERYEVKDSTILQGDAEQLDSYFQSVESVATDVPYGRSTKRKKDLYENAFEKIYGVSERACVVMDREYEFERLGFTILDTEKMRMHRSLTRFIYVLQSE